MTEHHERNNTIWSVLRKLARMDREPEFEATLVLGRKPTLEDCLRRVLRPHDEAGFYSAREQWMVPLRLNLDQALGELTIHEIRQELGLKVDPLPQEVLDQLRILFESDAFLRYLDAYLYFGVRFLASRPEFAQKHAPPCADSNTRLLLLTHPPELTVPDPAIALQALQDHTRSDDKDSNVRTALQFLDGFHWLAEGEEGYDAEESTQFELWLRGLWPEMGPFQTQRFTALSKGLIEWAIGRSDFYLSLNLPSADEPIVGGEMKGHVVRSAQGWLVTNPIASRLALADIYWIARLLCAEVSSVGRVRYQKYNWLHLLRFHALYQQDFMQAKLLKKAEDALRSVFDFACDLIQNSIEITRALEERQTSDQACSSQQSEAKRWRAVFNEELREIEAQRKIRRFRDPSLPTDTSEKVVPRPEQSSSDKCGAAAVWSDRVTTGERPLNLVGIAFSGGGIRSATLNLGVLQGLQELDLLRHIDYISTVSGGGFIGSWLVTNVRRSAHWLGRLTDWSDSIAHLRAYSNYLVPRSGILSADTWNLANSWFRNAFLIQLTGLAWLFVMLLLMIESMQAFLWMAKSPAPIYLGSIAAAMVLTSVLVNLLGTDRASNGRRRSAKWVRRTAVIPACVGGYALAAHLWAQADAWIANGGTRQYNHYSEILLSAWVNWKLTLGLSFLAFLIIAGSTLRRNKAYAIWIAALCDLALYLELTGVLFLFRAWDLSEKPAAFAFVFGPSLVLASFGLCVLLLIGFTGRNTDEAQREWWTRFGTWLGIFAGLGLVLSSIAIFSPGLMWLVFHKPLQRGWLEGIKWTSVASWIGTVLGGLFAGKSSKTEGGKDTKSAGLEILAQVGGVLFIFGSLILGATLLVLILYEIRSPTPSTPRLSSEFLCGLDWRMVPVCLVVAAVLGWLFSSFFEINIFGLNQFYRNRLVRCYLGATRWMPGARKPNPFTEFDFRDDLDLSRFRTDSKAEGLGSRDGIPAKEYGPYRGPLPIVNCTLNLAGSADLALNTRHSDSFTLTPLRCGSNRPKVGYAPTTSDNGKFADGVRLGQAVAISGAAVSSNMGYNTSPVVAFLLTMFNLRLGWWFPNPSQSLWKNRGLNFSFQCLLCELLGIADENRAYLNVSDGGHFENLGIYELVRRRCRLIIACDAECDEFLEFGGLGNLVRICETDFGASIEIDVKSIRGKANDNSLAHCAVGLIKYSSGEIGQLIYLKASMTGDEGVGVAQYRCSHPSFPHETTANQFFTEDQFESYRTLGLHMVQTSFKGTIPGDDPLLTAERLADVLTPIGCSTSDFVKQSATLAAIWERFRGSPVLAPFMNELLSINPHPPVATVSPEELCIGLELIQLMEDVFLDLRLDDFWDQPDNRGWAILFMRWARSPRFRKIWDQSHRTFGIRFEYFCNARLGLTRDQPIVKV